MRPWLFLLVALLLVAPARAQDVASGPTKGEKVPPLKVFDVTGAQKDKEVDYAAERKDRPTIYLLVQADKCDRPMNKFMRILDSGLKKDSEDAYMVAVWLTDEPDKTKQLLPRVQQSVQYENTALTYFPGGKDGPRDWNINGDAHLTVVIANKGKVVKTFGYRTVNDTDVPPVREAFQKALK
jgi:hypothetical protein